MQLINLRKCEEKQNERKNKLWKLGTGESLISAVWIGSGLSYNYRTAQGIGTNTCTYHNHGRGVCTDCYHGGLYAGLS